MTIAIAIAVPDGIALAADTQTTWHQIINQAKEKGTGKLVELETPISMPIGWSRMARKVFPLTFAKQHFALCTAGAASLNGKTMYSIFKSLELAYTGDSNCEKVTQYLVTGLKEELKEHHRIADLTTAPITTCDFILAGFDQGNVSKPFVESHLVFSGTINIDGKNDSSGQFLRHSLRNSEPFGGCWIGRTEFISHIINHKNAELPPIYGQFHMMTLADAMDYTRFLVEFTCDFQRFAIMVPDCGRPIVIASLTPDGYSEKVISEDA